MFSDETKKQKDETIKIKDEIKAEMCEPYFETYTDNTADDLNISESAGTCKFNLVSFGYDSKPWKFLITS